MEDFPANSRKAGAPESAPKLERVTSAEPVRRKKGLGRRFRETFIGGDMRSATDHVVIGVIIPTVKDMLYDAFDAGMRSLIFGENRPTGRPGGAPGGYSNLGRVQYQNYAAPTPGSKHPAMGQPRTVSRESRARNRFDDLIIPTNAEANEVLDQMYAIMERYGSVSVAHLYELTGIQSSHTDMKWGWTSMRGARAVRQRQGGFLLDLPEPQPLT